MVVAVPNNYLQQVADLMRLLLFCYSELTSDLWPR